MKRHITLLILCIILSIVIIACHFKTDLYSQKWQYIDNLMSHHPDSALIQLEKIDTTTLSYTDKMEYMLLYTQACDKNYIIHNNIMGMKKVTHYYDSIRYNISLRMKSHYYLGRIYQDIGDDESTVKHFIKAMELNEQCNEGSFSCMLYSNMGYIYYNHNLLEEADSLYSLALRYTAPNDTLKQCIIRIKLGYIEVDRGKEYFTKAEYHLLQAYHSLNHYSNHELKRRVNTALIGLYNRTGRLHEAVKLSNEVYSIDISEDQKSGIYLLTGETFYKLNKLDSAEHYLNKSLHTTSYGTKESSYLLLSNIAEQQGNFVKALQLNRYSQQYKDSSMAYEQPIKIIKSIQKNIRDQLNEQYDLSIHQYQKKRFILLIIVLLLIIIIIGYKIYKNSQHKKLYIRYHHILNNEQIAINKLNDLEHRLKECDSNHSLTYNWIKELVDEKNRELTILKNIIHDKNQLISRFNSTQMQHLISDTDIYKRLQTIIKYNTNNESQLHELNNDDWELLEETINKYFPNFIPYIIKNHTTLISEDIRFLSLIKLGFSYKEIQYIYNRSLDSIYKRDKSVKSKLNLGTKIKLKEYIKEL